MNTEICKIKNPGSCNQCVVYQNARLKLGSLVGAEKPTEVLRDLSKKNCPEGKSINPITYIV